MRGGYDCAIEELGAIQARTPESRTSTFALKVQIMPIVFPFCIQLNIQLSGRSD